MDKADELIQKYKLKANSYYIESPYKNRNDDVDDICIGLERMLVNKYHPKHLGKGGWYGISLGTPIPPQWYSVLDEFLEWAILECPDLELQQIKIKFGGIRIYLGNTNDIVDTVTTKLENVMYDRLLVY